jgi:hypothetical protein
MPVVYYDLIHVEGEKHMPRNFGYLMDHREWTTVRTDAEWAWSSNCVAIGIIPQACFMAELPLMVRRSDLPALRAFLIDYFGTEDFAHAFVALGDAIIAEEYTRGAHQYKNMALSAQGVFGCWMYLMRRQVYKHHIFEFDFSGRVVPLQLSGRNGSNVHGPKFSAVPPDHQCAWHVVSQHFGWTNSKTLKDVGYTDEDTHWKNMAVLFMIPGLCTFLHACGSGDSFASCEALLEEHLFVLTRTCESFGYTDFAASREAFREALFPPAELFFRGSPCTDINDLFTSLERRLISLDNTVTWVLIASQIMMGIVGPLDSGKPKTDTPYYTVARSTV